MRKTKKMRVVNIRPPPMEPIRQTPLIVSINVSAFVRAYLFIPITVMVATDTKTARVTESENKSESKS